MVKSKKYKQVLMKGTIVVGWKASIQETMKVYQSLTIVPTSSIFQIIKQTIQYVNEIQKIEKNNYV